MVKVGRPLGPPIDEGRRQVVRERSTVARRMVAEDTERSVATALAKRRRLNRGHRCVGRCRRDDPIQRRVDAAKGENTPWHEVTHDKGACSELKATKVAWVLR